MELRKIKANDGRVLTNGEVYGTVIYLGVNDSPDNWHEITEEEYRKILESEQATEEDYLKSLERLGVS